MCKKILSVYLSLLLASAEFIPSQVSWAQEKKSYTIAVLNLRGNGISEVEAIALSDMLRSSVARIIIDKSDKTNYSYKILERSQMDKMFEEFELQNIGCTNISCAVEFGKMLNAERIIIGSVNLVGSTYLVITRIVDVESSRIIASVDRKQHGVIDNVIDLMPIVGHELLTGERLAVPITTIPSPTTPITIPAPTEPQLTEQSREKYLSVSGTLKEEVIDIKLIPVPNGSFQMGSTYDSDDEKPVHVVTLDAFEMNATEITQGKYKDIMGENPSYFSGSNNLPVENVSWYDAVKFCNRLSEKAGLERCYDESTWICDFSKNGFRLPTEAEWEYACRAGTKTEYYTGDSKSELSRTGWYSGNSGSNTHPVGQKEPNTWDLYDMHGNVWEWCNDWFGNYSSVSVTNPTGIQSGSFRVLRGGWWYDSARCCRSADRYYSKPDGSYYGIGFRVVRRPGGVTY